MKRSKFQREALALLREQNATLRRIAAVMERDSTVRAVDPFQPFGMQVELDRHLRRNEVRVKSPAEFDPHADAVAAIKRRVTEFSVGHDLKPIPAGQGQPLKHGSVYGWPVPGKWWIP